MCALRFCARSRKRTGLILRSSLSPREAPFDFDWSLFCCNYSNYLKKNGGRNDLSEDHMRYAVWDPTYKIHGMGPIVWDVLHYHMIRRMLSIARTDLHPAIAFSTTDRCLSERSLPVVLDNLIISVLILLGIRLMRLQTHRSIARSFGDFGRDQQWLFNSHYWQVKRVWSNSLHEEILKRLRRESPKENLSSHKRS